MADTSNAHRKMLVMFQFVCFKNTIKPGKNKRLSIGLHWGARQNPAENQLRYLTCKIRANPISCA